ncbi:MAG: DUF6941 family protein, partial [Ardenticatenaceae bacterium]
QGVHQINLVIVNEDGEPVLRLLDQKVVCNMNAEEHTSTLNFVLNIHRLKLQQFGAHSVSLNINRRPMMSLPLFIRKRS